jgi:hypothetical protein
VSSCAEPGTQFFGEERFTMHGTTMIFLFIIPTPVPSWRCRPRTAAAGGRPQAGLEDVEKVLTATIPSIRG